MAKRASRAKPARTNAGKHDAEAVPPACCPFPVLDAGC